MNTTRHDNWPMDIYELTPRFINQKSFYHKAKVWRIGDTLHLYSYETNVCDIESDGVIHLRNLYSQTTTRHIKDFLKQNEHRFIDNPKYAALISSNYNTKELRKIITK